MQDDENLDKIFFALSDTTRRKILQRLADRDCTVSELAEPFNITLQAVMKHLKVLGDAGLISEEKSGRVRRCHFEAATLEPVTDWVTYYRTYWQNQLGGLEKYLTEMEKKKDDKT